MFSHFPRAKGWLVNVLPVSTAFAILFGFSSLPQDMSRAHIDQAGRLSVCMPTNIQPLVGHDRELPGFEAELMALIAEHNGWALNIVHNGRMATDFNPRHWRITRAQCQMLAGGISADAVTRSFIETTSPHLRTGWAFVGHEGATLETTSGPVAFYAPLGGLNRLALGTYLKALSVDVIIAEDMQAVQSGLESGAFTGAITEALAAEYFFSQSGFETTSLGEPLETFALGLGLWKGDQTLQLAVEDTLKHLWSSGAMTSLAARYNLGDALLCPGEIDCLGRANL